MYRAGGSAAGFGFPQRRGRGELGWSIIRASPHGRVQGLPQPLRQVLPAPVRRRPAVGLLLRRHGDLHTIVVSAGGTTRTPWHLGPRRGRFQDPPAPGHQRDPGTFRRPPVGGPLRRADGKQDPLRVAPAPPVTQVRRLGAGSRGLGPV